MKHFKITALLFFLIIGSNSHAQRKDSLFPEYQIEEFLFKGKNAKIVFPNLEPNGQWIWRARFWGHEPQTDKALLDKGFHLVFIDVSNLFGNQEAVELWNDFYTHCREKYALNKKVVLEGMSRGGLIIYNWAAQNTEKVACIYADAPVCDIKSWPGGLYTGTGSEKDWETCLKAHQLDTQSALEYEGIPVHTSAKVAKAEIPVVHVYGTADEVVPHAENTLLLAKTFEENGGKIILIPKEGTGHHPHSLKNPKPIVDFILENTLNEN